MTINQLIESYKAKIETIRVLLDESDEDRFLSINHRLKVKRSCYRTFITELERLKEDQESN